MRFDKYFPTEQLRPYIKYFAVSESMMAAEYKVFPSTGLVLGFQYRGQIATIANQTEIRLSTAGISGISDSYKVFKNSADVGTVLVYFTETGLVHFTSNPVNELFNQSIALENIFDKTKITETQEKLGIAQTDLQRIQIIERFFIGLLNDTQTDKLILEAVKMIDLSKGNIRIRTLNQKLLISQSPFEKRFRKIVGTTPKKFATIVRFNATLDLVTDNKSLAEICSENNFFDHAHFIKNFKQFTGETPENFKRLL